MIRSKILGIAGGSGSGKTTFARLLAERLGSNRCAILSQDSYYIDQSAIFRGDGENVNFDHPESLDFPLLAQHLKALREGHPIEVPIYDFVTHTRSKTTTPFSPLPWVILDGTLILSQPLIRAELEHSLFIQAPENVRFERRLRRDVQERGRTPEGVHKQFTRQVKPMHDEFIEPSLVHASEVISGLESFEQPLNTWVARL
jgi:uridine kinase